MSGIEAEPATLEAVASKLRNASTDRSVQANCALALSVLA